MAKPKTKSKTKKLKPESKQQKRAIKKRKTPKKATKFVSSLKKVVKTQRISSQTIKPLKEIKQTKIEQPIILPEITLPKTKSPDLAMNVPAKLPKPETGLIKRESVKISRHILDLKQIHESQKDKKKNRNDYAQIIAQEITDKLKTKKNNLSKNLHQTYSNWRVRLQNLNRISLFKNSRSAQFKNPAFSHKISWPKIALPNFKFRLPKLLPDKIQFGNFIIPANWKKTLLAFIVFCLIFILPFTLYANYQKLQGKKTLILQKTASALAHLALSQKAAAAQDLYYTQMELQAADENFQQAQKELTDINSLAQIVIKLTPQINKEFITAGKLIDIGANLSKSAAVFASAIDKLNLKGSMESLNLTKKLAGLKDSLNSILPNLNEADFNLQQISLPEIPAEYQEKIKSLQTALPLLEKNISNFISSSDLILKILGQDSKKRYLLLFQNNNEIRPTGGFIGSFALVDIDQGNVEKIGIPGGGPYDLKSALKVSLESPTPLHLMNPRWEFQDANWFANLPTSAEKLIWFYEKSGGPTVDGLIFINATLLEKLLAISGPIELSKYNKIISSDNFFQEIQEGVEVDYDKSENKPKQIIADLTPALIDKLLHSNSSQFIEIADTFLTALQEKEIQIYFTNFTSEKFILNKNWGGQLQDTDSDYLNVVSTNIAGEKTDAKIQQTANLAVDVQSDGTIINTLTLTKSHLGKKGEAFYGVPNLDYLRIYVPKDSQLLSATGFDPIQPELLTVIDPENLQKDPDLALSEMSKKIEPQSQTEIFSETDKTVFANWFKVEPGETKTAVIKYQLPFKINLIKQADSLNFLDIIKKKLNLEESQNELEKYSLLWQKQSGKRNFQVNVKINFPNNLDYNLVYPDNLIKENNTFNFTDQLNTDKFIAIIFRPF